MSGCAATAASTTSPIAERVAGPIKSAAVQRVAVAASGGRDSTALLHATVRAARGTALQVHALHVHHGLSAAADDWLEALRRQCKRWGVVLQSRHLQGRPTPGQSVEAWARRERYAALTEMATESGCTLVLLAHHRRDQAETFVLQSLRGGGAAGLSAMPLHRLRSGIAWVRPWLAMPREAIDAYVRHHRLSHVEDGSNADLRFDRNRLRLQVWPALCDAFGDAEVGLAAAAAQAQQAAALAAEVAALDLAVLVMDDGGLRKALLQALSPARRRNALTAWLAQAAGRGVPMRLLDRLMAELPRSTHACWPLPGGELRLYRGLLKVQGLERRAGSQAPRPDNVAVNLGRSLETPMPDWNGRFRIEPCTQGGVPMAQLEALFARPRSGGERFRFAAKASARSLKLQYQAMGVPSWERQGPLLYTADNRLLFVPGLGIDGGLQDDIVQPQWQILWLADSGENCASGPTSVGSAGSRR